MEIIEELKKIITKEKIDIRMVFKNFDKNKSGNLDKREINELLKQIKKNVSN